MIMNGVNVRLGLILITIAVLLMSITPATAAGAIETDMKMQQSGLTADFTYSPSTPNPDDEITLDASGSSTTNGSITSYEWDSDGDGDYGDYDDISDGQTSSVTFSSGGTYTVGLRITDDNDNQQITTKQITVDNPRPSAEFTYSPSSPNPDDEITLDASGSSDTDGRITSYEWDSNGDGVYSDYDDIDDGQTSSVTFSSGGTYTIGLRVTDNGGKQKTTTKQITVDNPKPTAEFTYTPSSPDPGDKITLDASGSSDTDGRITSYEWDGRGDGDYGDYDDPSDGQTSSITYESAGVYTISLRVSDNGAKTSTTSKKIQVGEATTESDQGSEDNQEVSQESEDNQEVSQELEDNLNAPPTFAEQSSSNEIKVRGNTEVLTFAVQNPNINNKDIVAEIVTEVPNGVSMNTASGSSSGSAALQSTSQTISPGQQDTMRLSISVDDESLVGERITIPYETRYYPVGNDETVYTDDQKSLEVLISEETASADDGSDGTSDSSPGFGHISALITIALIVFSSHVYQRS